MPLNITFNHVVKPDYDNSFFSNIKTPRSLYLTEQGQPQSQRRTEQDLDGSYGIISVMQE